MAIFVECPKCRNRQYDDTIPCNKCGAHLAKFSGKIYWIEFYNQEGRRKRERIGPNKALAETIHRKRLVERAEGKLLDRKKGDKVRFDQLVKYYLSLPEIKAKKSFIRDERSVNKLEDFFKTKPITLITPALISEYQSQRSLEKSYRGGVTKPATINREIACLKTLFNKAIRDGKLEKNPMRGVKMLPENNERDRVLSPPEWENYKSHCPSWYLPVAATAYLTAMRKAEILNLTIPRVDLIEGFIRLRSEETKTSKGRSIPIHPELIEVLKNSLKVRHLNCDLVFHRDGLPITPHDVRKAHEEVCKKAGISGFVFHDFRHTCINNWRKQGHDYFKIMSASGHKTISVFKRYNMIDEKELRTLIFSLDTPVDTTTKTENKKEVSANV
jgi:integrase